MKRNLLNIYHTVLFLICVLITASCLYYAFFNRRLHIEYTPSSSAESPAVLDNPYCGFYQMNGFVLSEKNKAKDAASWGTKRCQSDPYQLMLLEINLKNYAGQSLSQNALNQLDEILTSCEKAKKQIILRFLYDWDGKASSAEPSSLNQIETHMGQVASVINNHLNCVYILQGDFTGNTGEMHGSRFGSPNQVRQLMEKLADVTNPQIFLAVRTPAQLRSILRNKVPLTSTDAYGSTLASRLGLYNDGMLGSVYDLGTYDDTPLEDPSDFNEKGSREEEIGFQNKLCQFVPNGGEVTVDNTYNDLDNAIKDLADMHVSYLNSAHDPAVLKKWKSSVYSGDTIFNGLSGYDYIQTHLGYRYVLKDSSLDFHSFVDDTASLYLTIANEGFAPAYRKFTSKLVAVKQETGKKISIEADFDNRTISGNDSSIFTADLDLRSWETGTYELFLSMTDDATGCPIYFANQDYETKKRIPVGTVILSKYHLPFKLPDLSFPEIPLPDID